MKKNVTLPDCYTQSSLSLLESRFLKTDKKGKPKETPEDLFRRVAKWIAEADKNYNKGKIGISKTEKEFFNILYNLLFIPNSPTLLNAGKKEKTLSGCFVLPIEDSLDAIYKTLSDAVQVQWKGGGTGFNFSAIRPRGDEAGGIPDVAAGPIHFIKTFSEALMGIRQSGKRGGANIAILNVDHPDILEFIHMKEKDRTIMNFNISVGITDKFMEALRNDEEYELINPRNGKTVKRLSAKYVFDEIVELAHKTGDPGIAFVDNINNNNPTPKLGILNTTNPCGEQPLLAYESCNLGALNLRTHFDSHKDDIDWKKLKRTIHTAVHFLDNVIDVNFYPLKEIKKLTRYTNRKIGLGLMGFADVLMLKEIPYASLEGVKYARKVMKFIQDEGIKASIKLAKERGTFAAYKGSIWQKKKLPVRNATITTIAPNGNTSIIGGSTGGIEPAYSLVYKIGAVEDKNYRATQVIYNVNQAFDYLSKKYKFANENLFDKLAKGKSVTELDEIPDKLKPVLETAHEIDPLWHLLMQAAFQKNVDNAISKTINFPNSATPKDIRNIFIEAYKNKVKGVTIFRDGCKDAQTYVSSQKSKLNINETKEDSKKQEIELLIASKNNKKIKEIKEYIETNQKTFNVISKRFSLKINDELQKNATDKKLLDEAMEKAQSIGEEEQVITIADESGFILGRIRLPRANININYYGKDGKYTKKLFNYLLDHASEKGSKAYLSTALAIYDPFKDKLITTTTKIPGKLVTDKNSKYKMLFIHEGLESFKSAPKYEEFHSFHHRYTALNKIFDKFTNYKEEKIDIKLSKNAYQVLEKRSLLRNSKGKVVETPVELFHRIADYIVKASKKYNYLDSEIEEKKKRFFEALKDLEFLCGGAFIWAGMSSYKGKSAIWSKCFVLPIEDSIEGIFSSLNKNIDILRNGGGTGFNFSNIRSTYARVKVTGEHAAGPVEYLKVYNRAQDTIIGRGGRKMGSMAILDVDHPNIEEFIAAKDEAGELPNYNISVGITDKFMDALKHDRKWELIDPHDKKVYKEVKTKELFDLISMNAWQSGDPGVVFLDYLDNGNPTPHLGTINATNVCGEQPLLAFESCNLGNINLSKIVKNFPYLEDPTFVKKKLKQKLKYINWDRFEELIEIGVEFLDNVIDINNYPIKEIEKMTKKTRSVGLGLMGFSDLLVKLGIPYNSKDAIKIAEKLMKFLRDKSYKTSSRLGKERGNFPAFKGSVWGSKTKFMRNARCTTIAPTGTVSIVADCNPGIEPIFALSYKRKNSLGGTEQIVVEKLFRKVAKRRAFYTEELMEKIASGSSIDEIEGIPDDVKEIFKTSHEIEPTQHIKIQAAFQKYCDSGVSKTINLPSNATVDDVKDIYKLAYKLKCKGITIFRDGCKEAAQTAVTKEQKSAHVEQKVLEKPRERPDVTRGTTTKVKTEQGSLYVTINEDDVGIAEVFLGIGKSGGYTAGYCEAIGRLLSVSLRAGIGLDVIIHHLKGIRTSTPTLNKGMFVYSVPDAVAKVLEQYKKQKEGEISMLKETKKVEIKSEKEIEKEETAKQQNSLQPPASSSQQKQAKSKKQGKEDKSELTTDNYQPPPPKIDPPLAETNNLQPSTNEEVASQSTENDTERNESHYTNHNHYDMLPECPECGGDLQYAEGCMMCQSCGYSKCG